MNDGEDILFNKQSHPGIDKLYESFKKEINKHGGIKGYVRLTAFTDDELEPIARFFNLSVESLRQKGRVGLEAFDRVLDKAPYNGIGLLKLLETYFDEPLLTYSTVEERRDYLKGLQESFSLLKDWLAYVRRHTSDTHWIHDLIKQSPNEFEQMILYLSEGIRLLPSRPVRLSVFSQIITLNPDAFQSTTTLGQLWLHVLAETRRLHAIEPIALPETKQAEDDLLQSFNLYREDITDAVTVANLFAETPRGYHLMWEAAVHSRSIMTVPLREMVKLSAVYPAHQRSIVWVIDNPELFTRILDEVPTIPMICLQEKWSCAAWEVFDRLEAEAVEMRFVGDLTPESIVRAEELLMHYPKKAKTWQMTVDTYLKAIDESNHLSKEEKNLLDKHHLDDLACLKDEMKDRGHPAYLMSIVDELISELAYYYRD